MYSWAIRSSSSVVTPGAMAAAASARARAATRPARRIRSTVSASLTSEAVTRSGPSWNMYSGRGIEPGTCRSGLSLPFVRVPRGALSAREEVE